jgi:hypothetical protein
MSLMSTCYNLNKKLGIFKKLTAASVYRLAVGTFYDDGLSWSACNVYAYNKMNRRSGLNCDDACIFDHDFDFSSSPSMSVWCLCGDWMTGHAIDFCQPPLLSVRLTPYMLRGSLLNDQMPFGLPMWVLFCPHLLFRSYWLEIYFLNYKLINLVHQFEINDDRGQR